MFLSEFQNDDSKILCVPITLSNLYLGFSRELKIPNVCEDKKNSINYRLPERQKIVEPEGDGDANNVEV